MSNTHLSTLRRLLFQELWKVKTKYTGRKVILVKFGRLKSFQAVLRGPNGPLSIQPGKLVMLVIKFWDWVGPYTQSISHYLIACLLTTLVIPLQI